MVVVYIILGIVVFVLLLAAVMPGKYSIEKSIVVNSSQQKAYEQVSDFNKYRDWNPWRKMDPESKQVITGTVGAVGHKYEWDGKKIGIGVLTIKEVKPYSALNLDLEFIKPFPAKASDNWKFEKTSENETKIIWSNSGPLGYPMARLMGPMINKNLNKQFEDGLNSLKELCEK